MLRATSVLGFGEAARAYASQTLRPALAGHTDRMIFEAESPTSVARGTFESLRRTMPGFSFREAALSPLNLVNRADEQETTLIHCFQQHPDLSEVSGFHSRDGEARFFVARPLNSLEDSLRALPRLERGAAHAARASKR